jgi:3-hydroxybutyryl-CoA dehydrogenase
VDEVQRVGVVGAGLMGGGIAQVLAQAGIEVRLCDARAGAAAQARERITSQLAKLVEKGRMERAAAAAAGGLVRPVGGIADLAGCDVVIEAIVEDLEAKREAFRAIEAAVGSDAIIATNTSSLSVTAIASACARPGRVAGLHFFSPVPLMKVVEVIDGARTDAAVAPRLEALVRRFGHTPVRAKDTPGFLVNHAGRGYGTEALRILGEGIATFDVIDDVLRAAAGFRMGPFELLDLTGLDVSQPVMDSIYRQFYDEPRFRPSPLLAQRRAGGLLGRKSGEGFYRYVDGERQALPREPVPGEPPARVWLACEDGAAWEKLEALVRKLGARVDAADTPEGDALCVLAPWDRDATTFAVERGLDARRCVAIDTAFGLDTHRTLMATPVTTAESRRQALALFGADGVAASMTRDSVGFIAPRVVAHVVNVACDIAQQRIASPADIDRAVTLGLGYRSGPLAMGDTLGAARVLSLLAGMHSFYGDPRYRPSPWLTRRARLGVSLLAED